jgi:hypothetical protein
MQLYIDAPVISCDPPGWCVQWTAATYSVRIIFAT